MTIEAGVLALRITEQGADQVLAKLDQIDKKAATLGKATLFNAPSATGVSGQMQQVAMSFTQVGQAATGATAAVNANTTAQKQSQVSSQSLTATLATQLLTYQAARSIIGDVGRVIAFTTEAADAQTLAHRRLGAVARLTGTDLAVMESVSADARKQFRLSAASADELTGQFVKLSSRAGHVSETGQLMNAWLDLGAANGLTLDVTLQALTTTLAGQDEGLNKLGLMDPSQIWKKWADAAGMSVGQMTQQQKWQAIVNEVVQQGAKVNGEYQKSLETTQGKQNAFNETLKDTAAMFGHTLDEGRSSFYGIAAAAMNAALTVDKWWKGVGDTMRDAITGFLEKYPLLARLARLTGDLPPEAAKNPIASLESTPNVGAATLQSQLDAAAGFKRPGKKLTAAEKRDAQEIADAIQREERLGRVVDITGENHDPGQALAMTGHFAAEKLKGDEPAKRLVEKTLGRDKAIAEEFAKKQQFIGGLLQSVAESIGGAFSNAFSAAFQGGNFLAELGKSLLSSLGGMIVQLGESMLTYGTLMAVGAPLLMATPFAAQAMSAPAAIAAGIGLIALGAGMGAIGGKGGGKGGGAGGGGGSSAGQQQDNTFALAFDPDRKLRRGKVGSVVGPNVRGLDSSPMPGAVQPITVNATIIGPDDPHAQTQIAKLVKNAVSRGKDTGLRKAG